MASQMADSSPASSSLSLASRLPQNTHGAHWFARSGPPPHLVHCQASFKPGLCGASPMADKTRSVSSSEPSLKVTTRARTRGGTGLTALAAAKSELVRPAPPACLEVRATFRWQQGGPRRGRAKSSTVGVNAPRANRSSLTCSQSGHHPKWPPAALAGRWRWCPAPRQNGQSYPCHSPTNTVFAALPPAAGEWGLRPRPVHPDRGSARCRHCSGEPFAGGVNARHGRTGQHLCSARRPFCRPSSSPVWRRFSVGQRVRQHGFRIETGVGRGLTTTSGTAVELAQLTGHVVASRRNQ